MPVFLTAVTGVGVQATNRAGGGAAGCDDPLHLLYGLNQSGELHVHPPNMYGCQALPAA